MLLLLQSRKRVCKSRKGCLARLRPRRGDLRSPFFACPTVTPLIRAARATAGRPYGDFHDFPVIP
jgi:hypothetical protein